eukprot:TRINITY_DN5216_c1_g1_i2.p1 TRINITY_DN5216_c1_g1~~TRINITY_DN5216_c1_g1_i2.p1  ORF type:complete len:979 (+),score=219.75 TRINITY_DN5216_c1_g1_i2:28-2937(+)
MDLNGFSDPYVKLQLGRNRFRTKVVKKCLNPSWNEEFSFRVEDLSEELSICVLDEDKYFNDDFVGQLKVPISTVFDAENKSLGTNWYPLMPKSKKSKNRDCGEIRLYISLSQNSSLDQMPNVSRSDQEPQEEEAAKLIRESPFESSSSSMEEPIPTKEKSYAQTFAERFVNMFASKNGEVAYSANDGNFPSSTTSEGLPSSDVPETVAKLEDYENKFEGLSSAGAFDEAMKTLESRDQGGEMPSILPGGVLLDQSYMIAPAGLNSLIFSPGSEFLRSLAELQATTELQEGPWILENDGSKLKRVVTYTKAATKLVRAVKATEEQIYLKADGKSFAVFANSTMMKGMIEGGARQGLKDSYEQFADLLSKNVNPVDLKDLGSNKEQMLASLQMEQQSDWQLAVRYFGNFTVVSAVFIGLYVLAHILLAMPSTIQGLEFKGLDLPDSIGEVVVCGVLVLQGERVLEMVAHFMQARLQRGSDHGVKAQGDGWLVTVALIEGTNLAAVDSTGFSDPYVVFTCNGKTRTSSIKFQILDPQWNEIFEFDAMDEPPSTMELEVFDFDGPFDEATSLGHAEINFVKSNLSELADIWIPLQGKLAQACQSKLHLRIFLNNTRGTDIVKDYLTKMEKELGKKINLRSPQTNSTFQKLFGLPPEEFLINDFTCHLKRKMPMQGRLFLSARIIGFHANLFGHKTKFFFLWEDIEDIQVVPPSLASVGSPSLIIILRRGRGVDAKHGAKAQDEEGRLKFHFQSFVSFQNAHRTIMALWKARSLSPEQKVQIVEEESDAKCLLTEESGSFLGIEDASMSEVYSSILPLTSNSLMELFSGGYLERKVMEIVGCVDYSCTPWELVKSDVFQRQICYKFDKRVSRYGGEVTSTQQKSPGSGRKGWVIEEVMALQGVPLGDYFSLHLRFQVEDLPARSKSCNVQVFLGIAWLKSTKHQKRISKNVLSKLSDRLKEMFTVAEKELIQGK